MQFALTFNPLPSSPSLKQPSLLPLHIPRIRLQTPRYNQQQPKKGSNPSVKSSCKDFGPPMYHEPTPPSQPPTYTPLTVPLSLLQKSTPKHYTFPKHINSATAKSHSPHPLPV